MNILRKSGRKRRYEICELKGNSKMGVELLNSVSMSTGVGGGASGQDNPALMPQLVAAIRAVNRGELEARGRAWKLRRGAGKPLLVELVEQESGDVIDLLPPVEVLRMAAKLEKEW